MECEPQCLPPRVRIGNPPHERTNRQARHPRRSPTLPKQLRPRPKKAKAKQRETLRPPARTRANERAGQNERTGQPAQTKARPTHSNLGRHPSGPWQECGKWKRQQAGRGTNKTAREQETQEKRRAPRSLALPSPSDSRAHREQGRGKRLGKRHDDWALPSPRDSRGHKGQGRGQPSYQVGT